MGKLTYGATRLERLGGNKKGILKPDSKGYYTMIVGALNQANTNGAHYDLEGSSDHFEPSSSFQRRIREGQLYGEEGHPVKTSRISMPDFIRRVLRVESKNHCVHWLKVELDDQLSKRSDNELQAGAIAMVGTFKPSGRYGPALQASMENEHENVAFSVRTLTNTYIRSGMTRKTITDMVTLDKVPGPGMRGASKWNAPGLESDEICITPEIITSLEKAVDTGQVSLESDALLLKEIILSARSSVNDGFLKEEVKEIWEDWS